MSRQNLVKATTALVVITMAFVTGGGVNVAQASGALPTITAVTPYLYGSFTLDDVHFNWGSYPYGNPSGAQSSGGGAFTAGAPTDLVDYASPPWPWPRSYRALQCPNGCSLSQLPDVLAPAGATPTWVIGPWLRPNVAKAIRHPAPTVTAVVVKGSTVVLHVQRHKNVAAPVIALFRNGQYLTSLPPGDTTYFDGPPYTGQLALNYTAAACYSDCFPVDLVNGFAQQTTLSAPATVANPSPVPIIGTPPSSIILGQPVTFVFAVWGTPTPTTTVTSGSLPPGLTLDSQGMLTGTPTATGTFGPITVSAHNGVAPDGTDTFTITVIP